MVSKPVQASDSQQVRWNNLVEHYFTSCVRGNFYGAFEMHYTQLVQHVPSSLNRHSAILTKVLN